MSRGGRGRGRGRGKPFESLLPGEPPPPPILTPPPLFPPMEKRPLELRKSSIDTYLVNVKQNLQQFMQESPFSLKAGSDKKVIERYSDKYKQFRECEIDNVLEWRPDWKFFPEELHIGVKRRRRQLVGAMTRPNLQTARKRSRTVSDREGNDGDTSSGREEDGSRPPKKTKKVTFSEEGKLDTVDDETMTVVKEEKGNNEEEADGEGEGEADEAAEEVYDEEIEEEDTDYNVTYFDNGEDYGGDEEDALEEGPCY